jgi:hypothetical protein
VKIRIEAAPGELEARLDDVLATIREMGGGELVKAAPMQAAHPEEDRPLDLPVLQQAMERAQKRQVDRIQRVMQRKIAEVVRRAPSDHSPA